MGLIKTILSASIGGLEVKFWLGIIAALTLIAGVIIKIADNRDKRMIETAQGAGASTAVIAGQKDVLNQVERANNAEQEVNRSDDAARYDRCLRNATATSRANCERFRPVSD